MKNYFKFVAIIALFTLVVACENKSSNSKSQAVGDTPIAAQAQISPSGGTVTTSTVVAHESNVGETPASNDAMIWDEIIAAYPDLADRVLILDSIDKVVETDARTFDLYSGGSILLTLEYTAANDSLVVKYSAQSGFEADLITIESVAAEQTQGAGADRMDFIMSSCFLVKEEPILEPKQECASVVASLVLESVVEKHEQEKK